MATTYTRSGVQGTSSVDSYTTLYNTTAGKSAVLSTIAIVNTASAAATYRIGFDTTEGTPNATEWLAYGSNVPANDAVYLSLGVSIPQNTYIRVSSSANSVTFQAFVSEIT